MGVSVTQTRWFGRAICLLSMIPVIGCQDPGKPNDEVAPPAPAEQLFAGPASDIQLIAQTPVLGFRNDAGVLRAGYATHDVTVQDAIVELTPYHFANGERTAGGRLALQTGAILREDGTLLTGASTTSATSAGTVEIARGPVVEVLTNREDGIEQAWRFPAAPEGAGALTVEVQVSGHSFVSATDSGLHFQSPAGLGFRYSHAVWIDATSRRWPITSAWQDGRIAITVPEDILAESTFPAVLDPTVTAEVAVDAVVAGSTGQSSMTPAIAFDGTNYLVVWADQRLSRNEDIFATRVSQAGAILDPLGIAITAAAGRQIRPTVAFANGRYVVAWEDYKFNGGTEADIVAATVATDGVVTQLGAVAPSGLNETGPQIAANGTGALLVWDAASDVSASLFNGTSFGGLIEVNADGVIKSTPAVTAAPGGNYLVLYSEGLPSNGDVVGVFVTTAGAPGAAFTISAGAGRQYEPKASFDGTNYVVAWTNNNLGIDLFGTRVTTAGAVLDTRTEGTTPNVGGVAISTAADAQQLANLACTPGACIAVWQEGRNLATSSFDIFAQRLSTSPVLANNGAEIVVSSSGQAQAVPAVVTNGSDYFTVWHDGRDTNILTVFGARITAAGAVSDPSGIPLVTGNNREGPPALGRANTTFGVFWSDSRSFGTDIELVRFQGASKLDASALPVSTATFAQVNPAATSGSGNFVVVWNDSRNGLDRDIFGARVQESGAVVDAGGIAISTAAGDQLVPSIATSGTVSLVAWQDRRNGNFDIFGAIVDNATGGVGANFAICDVAGDQGRPSVAFDAKTGQFLVVWSDERVADVNIFGARVTAAGAVLDPNGIQISTGAAGDFSPRAVFLAGVGLVVWEDRRQDPNGDIFGRRVALDTGSLAPLGADFTISGAVAGDQNTPAVTALSGSFLVAWTDRRDAGATGSDIFGQQVGTTGSLNGGAFVISANPEDETAPALSDSLADNVVRIAYSRSRPDLQTVRVQTRSISTGGGTGQVCSANGQCSTGFCVDNRCCDTACGGNNATDCQACATVRTGQANGTCAFIPSTTICRNYANTFCDLREYCTGTGPDCPPDLGRNEGLVCNQTTGAVCPASGPPGPHGCP
jgi:large repetitive protein